MCTGVLYVSNIWVHYRPLAESNVSTLEKEHIMKQIAPMVRVHY